MIIRRCSVRLRTPFVTSRGGIDRLQATAIAISSEDGCSGTGWALPASRLTGETPSSVTGALERMRDVLSGAPLDRPIDLLRAVDDCLPGNHAAKAAVDLALHELVAARARISVAESLGAGASPSVATDVTIALDLPGAMAHAARTRVSEGFAVLKLKVGGGSVAEDVDRVVAVHDSTAGRAALRLDANQAWTSRQAVDVLCALHDQTVPIEFVEQPVPAWDLRGMRWVRNRIGCPVMADESVVSPLDVLRVIDAEAADMINVKIAKHGGIHAAQQVIAVASAAGLPCMMGSMMEPPSTIAASVALAATLPWPTAHDLDAALWFGSKNLATSGPARLEYAPPTVRT